MLHMKRVLYDIVLFACLLLLPWWVTAIVAFLGMGLFTQFYEFLIAGLVMYAIYRVPSTLFLASPVWFFVLIALVYVLVQIIRRYIIIYKV
jgi:hypothetical protein